MGTEASSGCESGPYRSQALKRRETNIVIRGRGSMTMVRESGFRRSHSRDLPRKEKREKSRNCAWYVITLPETAWGEVRTRNVSAARREMSILKFPGLSFREFILFKEPITP